MALWYFILLFNFDRPENPKMKKHYVAGALLLYFLQNMLQNLFSMQYFVGFKFIRVWPRLPQTFKLKNFGWQVRVVCGVKTTALFIPLNSNSSSVRTNLLNGLFKNEVFQCSICMSTLNSDNVGHHSNLCVNVISKIGKHETSKLKVMWCKMQSYANSNQYLPSKHVLR